MRLRDELRSALAAGAVLALALAACSKAERGSVEAAPTAAKPAPSAPPPRPVPPPSKDPAMSNDVTWKMTRSNTTIRLEYRFENTTPQTVYVNDGIVVALQGGGHFQAKNFLIETTRDPAVASVRIARPTGDVPAAVVPPGFYVPVAPKASFAGSRVIELPLRRRDAMGREHALPATIKNIAFAIEVFDGEPPAWREVKAKDGTPIKFPEGHSPRLVEGGVQPIP